MRPSQLIYSSIGVVIHLWNLSGVSVASRINVALSSTAIQSSTYAGGEAEHAIDGNIDGVYSHRSCTATSGSEKPWWRLELPDVYRVSEIEVTNRSDGVQWRLNYVEILIGNSLVNNGNNNPRCAIIFDIPGSATQTVHCRGMEGRFINFLKSCDADIMTMCEVKVYGELFSLSSIGILGMERNVTLVGKRLCWSDALLYCRDFHWDLLSIRGPEEQQMVNELVADASFPLTSHLWVGLRRSIFGESWFWMSGDSMDFTQWDFSLPQSSPCGGVSSVEPFTWRQHSCEEHLHFICFTGATEGVNKVHFYSSAREKQTSCSME